MAALATATKTVMLPPRKRYITLEQRKKPMPMKADDGMDMEDAADGVQDALDGETELLVDPVTRTIEVSFSSEEPVERWSWEEWDTYDEVLSHAPGAADLSRCNTGAAPMLWNHCPNDMRGVVVEASLKDKRGYCTLRFSRNPLGEQLMQDVNDGIVSCVSFFYSVEELVLTKKNENAPNLYTASKWTVYEISFVSMPADPSVGVGRSTDPDTRLSAVRVLGEPVAPDEPNLPDPQQMTAKTVRTGETHINDKTESKRMDELTPEQIAEQARAAERERSREIRELGFAHGMSDMAQTFIDDGSSLEKFRAALLLKLAQRSSGSGSGGSTGTGTDNGGAPRNLTVHVPTILAPGELQEYVRNLRSAEDPARAPEMLPWELASFLKEQKKALRGTVFFQDGQRNGQRALTIRDPNFFFSILQAMLLDPDDVPIFSVWDTFAMTTSNAFGMGKGDLIQFNKYPHFSVPETGLDLASRTITEINTIGTANPVGLATGAVTVALAEFAGPYNASTLSIQPFGITEKTAKFAQQSLANHGNATEFTEAIGVRNLRTDHDVWHEAAMCRLALANVPAANKLNGDKFVTGAYAGTFTADGSVDTTVTITTSVVKRLWKRMIDGKVPTLANGRYPAIINTQAFVHLSEDPTFVTAMANSPVLAALKVQGLLLNAPGQTNSPAYLGTYERFDFYLYDNWPPANSTYNANVNAVAVTGLMLAFGPDAWAYGEGDPLSVRQNKNDDYERFLYLIWRVFRGYQVFYPNRLFLLRSFKS